jgi:hypothetical protein
MSHGKLPPKRKRRRRAVNAVPILGLAGLSLSLANAASAAAGDVAPDAPLPNAGARHLQILGEEEITDVSLATFYVFDKENAPTLQPRRRIAMACGACAGCGCGGGCWTGQYLTPLIGGGSDPVYRPVRPAHRHTRTLKHAQNRKKQ